MALAALGTASGATISPAFSSGRSVGAGSTGTDTSAEVRALAKRDAEVRAHEQAHRSAGGSYAGAPSYQYQKGPDGKTYAVSGEVSIDTSTIRNDPRATIAKLNTVKSAALAPAQPSAKDIQVASRADIAIARASAELTKAAAAGTNGGASTGRNGTNPQSSPAQIARGLSAYAGAAGLGGNSSGAGQSFGISV